jgi:hypothetical protein
MPTNVRYPALLWQNHAGWFTAAVIERAYAAGTGVTSRAAMEQLEEFLRWVAQQDEGLPESDFLDAQLVTFHVPIRPEYVDGERRYPCPEPITLRVIGVTGQQAHGQRLCVLPTLGLRFYYDEASALHGLHSSACGIIWKA